MYTAKRAMEGVGIVPELLYVGDLRSPGSIQRAQRLIRRASPKYDIVHAQYGSALGWLISRNSHHTRTVLSIRGSDWTPWATKGLPGLHAQLGARLTRWSIRGFNLVLPVSHRIAREVREHSPQSRIVVLTDPVDLDRFAPRNRPEINRATLGLESDAPVVLFTSVSSGNSVKRLDLARAAIEHARGRIPNLQTLVGTGFGHDEMPGVVGCADVILCTSRSEGWPNSIKEALACDVPFVSTDVSDLSQIADHEPYCRVARADPTALGDALCDVLGASQARQVNLRHWVRRFSLPEYSEQLRNAYLAAMNLDQR